MNDQTKFIRQNQLRAVIGGGLRTVAMLSATGSLMQTFLVVLGFRESWIYIHSTLLQAANVMTILLCSRCADRGNILRRSALVTMPQALLFLFYLPLCFSGSASRGAFVYILGISVLQAVTTGLYTVFEYKIPYYVYRAEDFGAMLAIGGILANLISFGAGILMSNLTARYSYVTIMIFAFLISTGFLLIAAILQWFQRSLIPMVGEREAGEKKPEKVPLKSVIRHPAFWQLLPAHLLRGFAYGTTTVLAVICAGLGFDETVTTAMVSVQSLAMLAGCLVICVVTKHFSPRIPVFVGSMLFLFLPLLLIPDRNLFLSICFVILFGRTLIDYAVVDAMLYAVPVEIAGPYNAFRMVLHNGGTLLATSVAAVISTQALLWVTLICQVGSGLIFFLAGILRKTSPLVHRKREKQQKESSAGDVGVEVFSSNEERGMSD